VFRGDAGGHGEVFLIARTNASGARPSPARSRLLPTSALLMRKPGIPGLRWEKAACGA
jgi:hypothetical protein